MYKELGECNKGDLVIMWCIGWDSWDNEVVKVVDTFGLVEVEYKSGRTARMSPSVKVKVVSF